jgi:hypothetical protein
MHTVVHSISNIKDVEGTTVCMCCAFHVLVYGLRRRVDWGMGIPKPKKGCQGVWCTGWWWCACVVFQTHETDPHGLTLDIGTVDFEGRAQLATKGRFSTWKTVKWRMIRGQSFCQLHFEQSKHIIIITISNIEPLFIQERQHNLLDTKSTNMAFNHLDSFSCITTHQ